MSRNLQVSLLSNSHNFIDEALKKAVAAESDPINWKYAILSLVQSIELMLKERLRKEHSSLIYNNIDKPNQTVNLDVAVQRLMRITSIKFTKSDLKAIGTAKNWRNQILHYEFVVDPKELKIIFAQLLGFSMHFNKQAFDIFLGAEVSNKSWEEANKIMEYSSEVYRFARKIIEEENRVSEFVWDCPNCGFYTFVIEDDINTCYVCNFNEKVIECPDCKQLFLTSDTEEYQIGDESYDMFCGKCCQKRKMDDEEYYRYLDI